MAIKIQPEQVEKIEKTLNGDKRREVVVKVEDGKAVILAVQKKKI